MYKTNIKNLDANGKVKGTIETIYENKYKIYKLLEPPKIGWEQYIDTDIPVTIDSYNDDGTVNCTVDLSEASPQQQTAYTIKHFFDLQSKLFNNML